MTSDAFEIESCAVASLINVARPNVARPARMNVLGNPSQIVRPETCPVSSLCLPCSSPPSRPGCGLADQKPFTHTVHWKRPFPTFGASGSVLAKVAPPIDVFDKLGRQLPTIFLHSGWPSAKPSHSRQLLFPAPVVRASALLVDTNIASGDDVIDAFAGADFAIVDIEAAPTTLVGSSAEPRILRRRAYVRFGAAFNHRIRGALHLLQISSISG
uniref:Uncharacterized protein n=1 Tax=Panagrellus redivivus TaxID=6233 RepID=A0A7E5A1M9_PANRE